MSRIQQILAKAERDGTARRIRSSDDTAVAEPPHAAQPVTAREEIVGASIGYSERTPPSRAPAPPAWAAAAGEDEQSVDEVLVESRESVGAVLDPLLMAALDPRSPAAEQYRSLRSRIGRAESGQAIPSAGSFQSSVRSCSGNQ